MATYPERREDGSVWEIEYDPTTDEIRGERMVSGPTGGGGGGGGGLGDLYNQIGQSNLQTQIQRDMDNAYREAVRQGNNEQAARSAAIQAGSSAMSAFIGLLNAYGGSEGLDPNAIAAFIRGEGNLTLPSGMTLAAKEFDLKKRLAEAEMQANPRDIFKAAYYTAGQGGAAGTGGGALANAAAQAGVAGGGGGGAPVGFDAPGQGEFTRFVRGGQGGNMSPEAQTLYGQTKDGKWVAFESPEQFYQAAGVKSFKEAWDKNLIENRNGELSGQGIWSPPASGGEGAGATPGAGGGIETPRPMGAEGFGPYNPSTDPNPWRNSTPGRVQMVGNEGFGATPGAGGGMEVPRPMRPEGFGPYDPATERYRSTTPPTFRAGVQMVGNEGIGATSGTGNGIEVPTIMGATGPRGQPATNYTGSGAGYDPRLYNLPFYQQLRERYGSSEAFPFKPGVPLPQPNKIPLGAYSQQSPFNQGLLEAAYSTAGLSKDIYQQPQRTAQKAFSGFGGY